MAKVTSPHVTLSGCIRASLALLLASTLALVGCTGPVRKVPALLVSSETEIAVQAIKAEWLKLCDEVVGPPPENEIGNLLLDYNALAGVAAPCRVRHNSLVEYLAPVVAKERERVTKDAK